MQASAQARGHSGESCGPKRITIEVKRDHVGHIRACLDAIKYSDLTVSPVISGWGLKGYWSSESQFSRIGERVVMRFTAHHSVVQPLITAGFGILADDIVLIGCEG